jgi:catechol 2,3-dioxygenase
MQNSYPSDVSAPAIHPATDVGTVTLKVADLQRSLAFYTRLIGLQPLQQDERTVVLGAGKRPILKLEAVPGAKPLARNTTGLYHAAILLPDRHALAVKVAQLSAVGYPLGHSDHLVSEAFYLDDPDRNGLELYRDRPRSEWTWVGKQVQMALDPIDFDSLFAEIPEGDPALQNPALPDGTKLGHMHLRVGDIDLAEQFYHGVLGFGVVAKMQGALFVSAGGYHHHLGMNTWESRGAKPPVEPSAGLREFSIALPDQAELDRLTKQIEAVGVAVTHLDGQAEVCDPWQNQIKLILKDQLEGK